MKKYYVFEIEKDGYRLILYRLQEISDKFCLVEPVADTEEFPCELPEPKKTLEKYMIERKRTFVWPGTKLKGNNKKKAAIQHFYKCTKSGINALKEYSDFFQYEDQMDIAFFEKEHCILYTISHEGIVAVDMDYWGNFFDKIKCRLIKMNKEGQ